MSCDRRRRHGEAFCSAKDQGARGLLLVCSPLGFCLYRTDVGHSPNVPTSDLSICSKQRAQKPVLLDQFIGPGEQGGRNREAERLGSLEVDDQLDFRRLLDGYVGWRGTLENLAGIDTSRADRIGLTDSVAHQPSG